MFVKHSCGHEVDVSPRFAPFVRRELCPECKQIALKLQQKQSQKFNELLKEKR